MGGNEHRMACSDSAGFQILNKRPSNRQSGIQKIPLQDDPQIFITLRIELSLK